MKKIISLILVIVFTFALSVSVFADYPKSDSYFYDGADIISDEAEAEIKSVSNALFVSKGYRIAVCTVDNTGDVPMETYARGVFADWKFSGIILLIVKSTEQYYSVQSLSIAEVMTNAKVKEINDTYLEADFNEGNYSAGVSATVKAYSSFITENVPAVTSSTTAPASENNGGSKVGKFFKGLGIFILIVAILACAGYGLLVYLEKKKERERRLRLEERRRRLAKSGRGNFYGNSSGQNQGQPYAGNRDPRGSRYQNGAHAPGQGQYSGQNANRSGDRFVYPDPSSQVPSAVKQTANRQRPVNGGSARPAPPRGQRVDFDKEYYSGSASENTDASATREFTRN